MYPESILDSLTQPVALFDGAGVLLHCNAAFGQTWRVCVPGASFLEIFPEVDFELAGGAVNEVLLRSDLLLLLSRHSDDLVLASLQESSAATRQLRLLAEAEELTGGFTFEFDRASLQWWVSPNWFRIVGRASTEQPTSEFLLSPVGVAQPGGIRRAVEQALNTGEDVQLEHTLLDGKGIERIFLSVIRPVKNEQDEVVRLVGAGRDITELKRAAGENERFLSAVEHSGEMIVITDRDARIVYVNPEFERVTGYTAAEARGQTTSLWRSGVHDQAIFDDAWEQLQKGERWRGHLVNRKKDGSLIREEVTISQVTDRTGEVIGYVEIKRDITRQRELEQNLAHSQRMESIGTLAGGVAHDFNNSLQTILGNAQLLLLGFADNPDVSRYARDIEAAAATSASLTQQLLVFARRQASQPRPLDIGEELPQIRSMLQRLIGANIEMRWENIDGFWPVRMDPAQLNQVITNICVNARDAISGVGVINIRLDSVIAEEATHLTVETPNEHGYVVLSIEDNGCGMSLDVQRRMFEPFFTTKAVNEGTGLGLATVYGVVTQNGGDVRVSSVPGQGSRFDVYLPRYPFERQSTVHVVRAPAPTSTAYHVLVCDDEESIVQLISTLLVSLGYRVAAFTSPVETLSAAAGLDPVDLIVSDVIMPVMNGTDMVRKLREHHPQARVIFTSGYTADVLKSEEMDDFLHKPFSNRDLVDRIQKLLNTD